MTTAGNATIPTWLHHIYGSHESGTYGQIGNATDAWASDTITIPAGADVELANIKVNSSVKVVVEKGAKLTLTDSVVYGELEVNDGTLVVTPEKINGEGHVEPGSSAINGVLTLNGGSTLENSQVVSNAKYLTDGRHADVPAQAVVVNGTVTFQGDNSITAAEGQTGLKVNGTAEIPAGSTLTVTSKKDSIPSKGGAAVSLENGTVTGDGTLVATGGEGAFSEEGGKAVVGTGAITTKGFEATGGSSDDFYKKGIAGKDAGEKGVVLLKSLVDNYKIAGGTGTDDAADGIGLNSFTIKDDSTPAPGPDPDQGGDNGGNNGGDNGSDNGNGGDNGSGNGNGGDNGVDNNGSDNGNNADDTTKDNGTKDSGNEKAGTPKTADYGLLGGLASVGAAGLAAATGLIARRKLR